MAQSAVARAALQDVTGRKRCLGANLCSSSTAWEAVKPGVIWPTLIGTLEAINWSESNPEARQFPRWRSEVAPIPSQRSEGPSGWCETKSAWPAGPLKHGGD